MPLFEIAVMSVVKKKDEDDVEKLLYGPTSVVAKSEQAAGYKVLLDQRDKFGDADLDSLQVLIRPFG